MDSHEDYFEDFDIPDPGKAVKDFANSLDIKTSATKFHADNKALFIRLLGKFGVIQQCLDHLRISRTTYYKHLKEDPDFKIAVEQAKEEFAERCEAMVVALSLGHLKKNVWYQGQIVGSEPIISEKLLEQLNKVKNPSYQLKDSPSVNFGGVLFAPSVYTDMDQWCRDNGVEIVEEEKNADNT